MPGFVDLFAGCGGLSLGLHRAGFRHLLAVEKSPMAAETYYHNFIQRLPPGDEGKQAWQEYLGLELPAQAERGLVVDEVGNVLADKSLMSRLRQADLDLVVGGPPCQGFSMAGRRDPSDVRNQLAWQFLEFVEATCPKAVVIENVVGIGQDFVKRGAKAPLAELALALSRVGPGYLVQPMRVNAMHYGVAQHRPRVIVVGLREDLASAFGRPQVLPLWSSTELPMSPLCPPPRQDALRTVRDALWDLAGTPAGCLGYRVPIDDPLYFSPGGRYAAALRWNPAWLPPALPEASPPVTPPNGAQRSHTPAIALRFELYQYLDAVGIRPGILNVAADPGLPQSDVRGYLTAEFERVPLPARSPQGRVLAETREELVDLVVRAATKKHSQRPLRWDEPSPTVMSLPDDFVHPVEPRTLAVREMARLQSFPDLFEFRSKETTGSDRRRHEVPQYTQVGNAVPPLLAEAVGRALRALVQA